MAACLFERPAILMRDPPEVRCQAARLPVSRLTMPLRAAVGARVSAVPGHERRALAPTRAVRELGGARAG